MGDSLICNTMGEFIIFRKFVNARGYEDVEVVRQ